MLTLLLIQSDTVGHGVATREGWDILDCGPDPDSRSRMQLQREDCPEDREPPFATHGNTWSHAPPMAFHALTRAKHWPSPPAPGPSRIAMRSQRSTTPSAC